MKQEATIQNQGHEIINAPIVVVLPPRPVIFSEVKIPLTLAVVPARVVVVLATHS